MVDNSSNKTMNNDIIDFFVLNLFIFKYILDMENFLIRYR